MTQHVPLYHRVFSYHLKPQVIDQKEPIYILTIYPYKSVKSSVPFSTNNPASKIGIE